MSEIQRFMSGSRLVSTGDSKRVARAVSRGYAISTVRSHDVQDETDVMLDKIEAATSVTGQTIGATVLVALAQQEAETRAPAASGRLALLADNHALIMANFQTDHARTLRRK